MINIYSKKNIYTHIHPKKPIQLGNMKRIQLGHISKYNFLRAFLCYIRALLMIYPDKISSFKNHTSVFINTRETNNYMNKNYQRRKEYSMKQTPKKHYTRSI